MSTKKIQIIGSSIKHADNADTLDGKHADEFATTVYVDGIIDNIESKIDNKPPIVTPEGGVIFGDLSNKALGESSFSSGAKKEIESDTSYPVDEDGNPIIPDDAWRYNEAVGTASAAIGMGNVAFSRASKALGLRTQTGYPPTDGWLNRRPELVGDSTKPSNRFDPMSPYNRLVDYTPLTYDVSRRQYMVYANPDGELKLSFRYLYKVPVQQGFFRIKGMVVSPNTPVGSLFVLDITFDSYAHRTKFEYNKPFELAFQVPEGEFLKIDASIYAEITSVDDYAYFDEFCYSDVEIKENVGQAAVAIGADTVALENHSVAGGWRAIARGKNSIAFGSAETYSEKPTEASGYGAVAIGYRAKASGSRAIAIGMDVESSGKTSVAFGNSNKATAEGSLVTGVSNTAGSYASIAGGNGSATSHVNSVAIGRAVKTGKGNQAVFGQFNSTDSSALLVVGKGTTEGTRGNAFVVKSSGDIWANGKSVHSGADYAEFFEWIDGNPDAEDRIGMVVTLEGEKIRPAMPGDEVLGIVSGTAAVLGDAAAMHWKDKYLTDEFGRLICDMVEDFVEYEDPETGEVVKESAGVVPQPRLNPDYNPEHTYIPREERKEWDKVGILGKLYAKDDGTCKVGGYGRPGENGVLTHSDAPTNIRVMKRTADNIVWVLLK